jgi:flagellar motility protein MotE (MotC chaperone)
MNRYTLNQRRDRITITRPRTEERRRPLIGWSMRMYSVGGWLGVIMALCWTMVQLNYASSTPATAPAGSRTTASASRDSEGLPPELMPPGEAKSAKSESASAQPPQAQGPALNVPEEVVAMLQQRQEDLDRREKTVQTAEKRFTILRAEIEQILSKVEAAEQKRLRLKEQKEKEASAKGAGQSQTQKKQATEQRSEKYAQLTKMYESMPAEEAAARIEQMPDRKALEILRLVKGKTAGSILAQVKVDRAAKLTEQLLANP